MVNVPTKKSASSLPINGVPMTRREFILGLTGAAAGWSHAALASQTAPAMPEVVKLEPLVSVSWLQTRLTSNDLVVLDIRSAAAFSRGHIPGAINSDYEQDGWSMTPGGSPPMLPNVPELEALIGDAGIDTGSRVVVVPAGLNATEFGSAARIYWTLKLSGIENVSILDGGFAAWQSTPGAAVDTRKIQISPTIFTATINNRVLAGLNEVEAIERVGGATLIDARPFSFFAGKEKIPAVKAYGHIPGALSLDSATFYDSKANRLKRQGELAKIASAIPEGPIVAYCNAGHWAATDWFVLHELLCRKNVKLYYGSMIEWTTDPRRPVAVAR